MRIFILGFGVMGKAIGRALARHGGFDVWAHDRQARKVEKIRGVRLADSLKNLQKYDTIILSVKPQDIAGLARQIRGKISPKSILVSIAAGVSLSKLSRLFNHQKVVRVMPNLGMLVGEGIAGFMTAPGLPTRDKKLAKKALNAFSENFEVKNEDLVDAVTAISANGPAYFFLLADCLQTAALNLGLDARQSRLLVEKTMSAAALLQKGQEYRDLIKKVRSKKGTTDASLNFFAKKGVGKLIEQAVMAGYKRAKELSKGVM